MKYELYLHKVSIHLNESSPPTNIYIRCVNKYTTGVIIGCAVVFFLLLPFYWRWRKKYRDASNARSFEFYCHYSHTSWFFFLVLSILRHVILTIEHVVLYCEYSSKKQFCVIIFFERTLILYSIWIYRTCYIFFFQQQYTFCLQTSIKKYDIFIWNTKHKKDTTIKFMTECYECRKNFHEFVWKNNATNNNEIRSIEFYNNMLSIIWIRKSLKNFNFLNYIEEFQNFNVTGFLLKSLVEWNFFFCKALLSIILQRFKPYKYTINAIQHLCSELQAFKWSIIQVINWLVYKH